MAGRTIRSALLIDIENVSYARLSTSIPNWLAWLEHGQFDPAKQRRKFVVKRAYWNSTSEHDRKKFESRGVDAILVDRYVTLKNTADVHMAIDIIELLYTRPDIEEYVLLSKDSDFIPVMQRLRSKQKKTAMLVDLASPTLHTAFRDKVDIVIPHRDLLLATAYSPPVRKLGLIGRWRARLATKREQAQLERDVRQSPAVAGGKLSTGPELKPPPAQPVAIKLPEGTPIQQAASLIGKLLQTSRGLYVPQKAILTQLRAIPEFTELGTAKYLGAGSYHDLMSRIAATDPLMKVDLQNGGHTAVRYLSVREQINQGTAAAGTAQGAGRPGGVRSKRRSSKGVVAATPPPPVGFSPEQAALLDQAVAAIRALAEQRPGAYLPRQGLLDAISAAGIPTEPPGELLGTGGLAAFMFEVARRDPDFLISDETGGGKGYRYISRDKPHGSSTPTAYPQSPASRDDVTPVPSLPAVLTLLTTLQSGPDSNHLAHARQLEPAGEGREHDPPHPDGKRWDLT
jgi:uncharacterized LabA/DUF88 family protein